MANIGDLVDADFVDGIRGATARLRGIVIGTGTFQGQRTHSVAGVGESTSASTMPVAVVARAGTPEATTFLSTLRNNASGRTAERLDRVAANPGADSLPRAGATPLGVEFGSTVSNPGAAEATGALADQRRAAAASAAGTGNS